MSLPFLRADLTALAAYTPQPGGAETTLPTVMDTLDTNECPYDLPQALKEKLAWQYQHEILANRYPDGGHWSLKTLIAEYVTANAAGGAAVATDHISVGNGSDELIRSLLIATCVGGAGSILVAHPTFSMYGILARTLGIPVVTVDRDEETFAVNLEQAQAAVASVQTPPIRAVFMVHPNSPTANALTTAELDWLKQLPETVLVVVDEAYFEFSRQTTVPEVWNRPNWVVLRTFSKAFRLAAHRVGYAVASPELTVALEKVRLPYNLPSFSQAAARLVLEHRQQLLAATDEILEQRDQLLQAFRAMPQLRVWPSQANFIYVRPHLGGTEADDRQALTHLFDRLKAQGTLVRQTGGGLRITVGASDENERTLTHLRSVLG